MLQQPPHRFNTMDPHASWDTFSRPVKVLFLEKTEKKLPPDEIFYIIYVLLYCFDLQCIEKR